MKRFVFVVFAAFVFLGCDKITKPLDDQYGFIELPKGNKTVLIEEFTGVLCTHCPAGARKIQAYIQTAPENVVAVAIHASGFSTPFSGEEALSTPEGEEFYQSMGSGGLPGGLFDRTDYPNDVFKKPGIWDELLNDRLSIASDFNLTGEMNYNVTDSVFTLKVNVLGLSDIEVSAINLTAYLLEDGIITTQDDKGVRITDYEQNHVFRSSFAGMRGEEISGGAVAKGQIFTKTYTLKIDPERFKVENCSAVMFIYHPSTQEVLQAGHAEY